MNDLTPFESSVCALIESHDSAHPTHSREVAQALGLRQTRQVRRAVESAIQKGALIGSLSTSGGGREPGWFWIHTEADLEAVCGDIGARVAALRVRADALRLYWAHTHRHESQPTLVFGPPGTTDEDIRIAREIIRTTHATVGG